MNGGGHQAPLVVQIKRNALDDGPGIRTAVFFKGCPLRCAWCHNPECLHAAAELAFHHESCIDCRDCAEACPEGAIGPAGPTRLDRRRCKLWGACAEACPSGALEIVGRRRSLDELAGELLRDRAIYRASGGGVTLTGGEATLYPEYVGTLAAALHGAGAHVLLETCGHFDWARVQAALLPHVDAVYFDLKLADPVAHARHCGRDNARILENLDRSLAAAADGGPALLVRVPLVPGVTDTVENLAAIAGLLRARGLQQVSLLPYNPLWGPKAEALGRAGSAAADWAATNQLALAAAHFVGFEVV